MTEPLESQFPSQGWNEILTARKRMLEAYDMACEHEAETYHGKVAAASFREWLVGFLPKRFGVTSGYVISPGSASDEKKPHFEVIIYDALESPFQGIEKNPDSPARGQSMAIPVGHVRAVLEVKSHFSSSNVKASLDHLRDLSPIMNELDATGQQSKFYLPPSFRCGVVFFDLRRGDANDKTVMIRLLKSADLRGFFGGMILRGETHTSPKTARLALIHSEEPMSGLRGASLLEIAISDTVQLADKVHLGSMLQWSESVFAEFAFDLLAMLRGTFKPGEGSSFYGSGGTFADVMRHVRATKPTTQ